MGVKYNTWMHEASHLNLTEEVPTSTTTQHQNKIDKALLAIKRYAISTTVLLPFSSRSIPANIVRTPIRCVKNLRSGTRNSTRAMPYVLGKTRTQGISHIGNDWNRGIQDIYKDLSRPTSDPKELQERLQIVQEYLPYAKLQYANSARRNGEYTPSGHITSDNTAVFPKPVRNALKRVQNLGFQSDSHGGFYDTRTGTMFNLAFDERKSELVICFHGLGSEGFLSVDCKTQKKLTLSSRITALSDWLGGVSSGALQAMELGKILKSSAEDSGITPVVVGHSHGGGLAQCAALSNGIKGVVFNSRPMGAGMRRYIGQATVAKNAHKITAFSGQGDWLTRNRALNILSIATERFFGIPVARTVGNGYILPRGGGINEHIGFRNQLDRLETESRAKQQQIHM